jgi:hypothetical protein
VGLDSETASYLAFEWEVLTVPVLLLAVISAELNATTGERAE